MKLKMLFGLCIAFSCLVGCGRTPTGQEIRQEQTSNTISRINYIKDLRTNLCFAHFQRNSLANYATEVLTTVPCEAIPPGLLNQR